MLLYRSPLIARAAGGRALGRGNLGPYVTAASFSNPEEETFE